KWRIDAETPSIFNHGRHANALREFQSGNIARIGQRMLQGNIALKLVVEVVRLVGYASAQEDRGSVEYDVIRLRALIDRCRIDKRLKRRSHLALRLCRAIKFGFLKVASSDHGLDVSGSIIERQQGSLSA